MEQVKGELMPFAIELLLDEEGSDTVIDVWQTLALVSGSDYLLKNNVVPHIALAVTAERPSHKCTERLEELSACTGPLRLGHCGTGYFDTDVPVVFLSFGSAGGLGCVHAAVSQILNAEKLDAHQYYRVPLWQPHCTLAMGLDSSRLAAVKDSADTIQWPPTFNFTTLSLVEYPPTNIIWCAILRGG